VSKWVDVQKSARARGGPRPEGRNSPGPRATLTPLPTNSLPMAYPREYINPLSNVLATLIPAGKTETPSVNLTPAGESSKHNPFHPIRSIGGIFPTHALPEYPLPSHPNPVVRLTFSSMVRLWNWMKSLAFWMADSQVGPDPRVRV
jgi:hypothetical protein